MSNVSKSPERHTFQKESYIQRKEETGEAPSPAYLEMWDRIIDEDGHKFDSPESRKDNLEYDLVTTDWILEKARASEAYAQNIYAALCNMQWCKAEMWPILSEQYWSCSWRYAGGIVADMRQEGDYIDWYCSGMGGLNQEYDGSETNEQWQSRTGYVPESVVTDEIEADFRRLGWYPVPYKDDDLTK
jgi:hypothetical protein